MDTIDKVLATNALSSKYSVAIHAALSVGKKTLNRYYEKTDFSKTYRIAMGILWFIPHFIIANHSLLLVLHPRHKLNYFKNVKWEDDWIEAARQLVRDEFDSSYNYRSSTQGPVSSNRVCITHLYMFHISYLLFCCVHNRLLRTHQKATTFLIIWLHLPHLSVLNFVMSLITILALTLSMLSMLFVGGMIIVWSILV
jgi:hypothetical protein